MKTQQFEATLSELTIDNQEIYMLMGYGNHSPDQTVVDIVKDMLNQLQHICVLRYAFRIVGGQVCSNTSIMLNDIEFTPGKIIVNYLKQATDFAVFLATAGTEFDMWKKAIDKSGDMLQTFIADAIGSVIAEAVVELCLTKIKLRVESSALNISNNYSPGYCSWHLRDQEKIFTILAPNCCEVHLTDSFLMQPIKSVTGIVGIGADLKKEPYGCAICTMKNCYKNKLST